MGDQHDLQNNVSRKEQDEDQDSSVESSLAEKDEECPAWGGSEDDSKEHYSWNGKKDLNKRTPPSRIRKRHSGERQRGWENLSSGTVYSGQEGSIFDMSSRSLLEDFDFEADDDEEDEPMSPPRAPLRFSAGKVLANRDSSGPAAGIGIRSTTPMSRITEHTRESSCYGSDLDMSGRNSFASASSLGKSGRYIGRTIEGSAQRRPSYSKMRSFEFSPSPKTPSASKRRCDILNIKDLQSLVIEDIAEDKAE
jgi:hypothetical protein